MGRARSILCRGSALNSTQNFCLYNSVQQSNERRHMAVEILGVSISTKQLQLARSQSMFERTATPHQAETLSADYCGTNIGCVYGGIQALSVS